VRAISDIERGTTTRPRRSSIALLEAALRQFGGNGDAPPAAVVPADRTSSGPRQLPPTVPGFTGRTRELDALTHLLGPAGAATGPVVISAIAGTAGVGKTALALHWAHQAAERYPDGQLYVNLRGYDPDRPVPAASALAWLLRALGVAGPDIPPEPDERAALYRSLLAGRRMLVVLDNAGSAEQVRLLLPGTVTCGVLVTSRDSLAGLVARDGAARLDLDLLPMADAIALLRTLIGGRADTDPGAAEALATQCSRLPLALRVAAEFVTARPEVSLASLAGELADQQRRLDLLDADGDPRAGVRAVFSWSYRDLGALPARVFRRLGLHPGPDLDAQQGRYRRAIDRHEQALALYQRIGDQFGQARSLNNLGAVELYLGRYRQAVGHLGRAEALSREAGAHPVTGYARLNLGAVAFRQGNHRLAIAHLTEAMALSRQIAHPALEVSGTVYLARIDLREGRYEQAEDRLAHALARSRELGDRAAETEALSGQGELSLTLGQGPLAVARYTAVLGLASRIGDQYEQARAHDGLARGHHAMGSEGRARRHWRRALTLFTRLGAPEAGEVRTRLSGM
jgi:tetratricopeptide (TPR) repeat protein